MKYICFLLVTVIFSCGGPSTSPSKPNVLFIFIDDLAYDALHYQGNQVVQTPNMDRLAAGGVNFTNAYNMGSWSGAVCTASRSMLISGLSVWRTNEHRKKWQGEVDSVAVGNTWGKLMEKRGYDTYMTGKWHVDLPADQVFQEVRNVRPGMPRDNWNQGEGFSKRHSTYKAGQITYNELMGFGYNRPLSLTDTAWNPTDTANGGFWEGGKHWSEVVKDDALVFAEKASQSDNPYFMYLAFNAAHDPRQSPQEYLDLYPLESIKLPENYQENYYLQNEIGVGYTLRDEALAPFPRTEHAIKVHLQEYYALITHLDIQIGQVMDGFEKKGLLENTLVILTADHGLAMGSHGLMGKQNMHEHSIRVPFILNGRGIPSGVIDNTDVYLQDAMATALDATGEGVPSFVEFHSLLPIANGAQVNLKKDGVYGAYLNKQRMIRKDGFKLILYPTVKESLLYDLSEDPFEKTDISDEPGMETTKKKLFLDLKKLQKQLDDTLELGEYVY